MFLRLAQSRFSEKEMEDINHRIISYLIEKGFLKKADYEKLFLLGHPPPDFSVEEHIIKPGLITVEGFQTAMEGFFGVQRLWMGIRVSN